MTVLVRAATVEDIRAVVCVHQHAFPGFMLTLLGPPFLRRLYRGFVSEPGGVLLVAQRPDRDIVGLLAGARMPAEFFGRMRRRHGIAIACSALPALLRHPLRVGERLLSAVRYQGDRPMNLPGYWLLSSLGVRQADAGGGAGTALVRHFCDAAREQGAPGVYLLTDKNDNAAVERFYAKQGFTIHTTQRRRDGRQLLMLVRSFDR
ncbi:MAG: GNAT family N-acetyltransferase [Steroidobacteraceae bacterium]